MARLDAANCSINQRNTGFGRCPFNPDFMKYLLAVPKGTTFSATDLADLEQVIRDGFLEDAYIDRFHLFGDFVTVENQSEERQQTTFGDGSKRTVRDAQYSFRLRHLEGFMCAHKNALAFNGRESEYDFFVIDNANQMWGTDTLSATGTVLFRGYDLSEFYEEYMMPKDGSDETQYWLSISFKDAKQLNQNFHSVTLDFHIGDLPRILDVNIEGLTALTGTGEINLLLTAGCGGDNLVSAYAALVASGNFVVQNAATGAGITITSVTTGGIGDDMYMVLNLDSTDTDYPASGGFISVDLAAPSVLIAVNSAFTFDGVRLLIQVP